MNTASIEALNQPQRSIKSSLSDSKKKSVKILDALAKIFVLRILKNLKKGHVQLFDGHKQWHFGETENSASISVIMTIHHPSAYRNILFGGTIGGAEAFINGTWSCNDLLGLTRIMCQNLSFLNQVNEKTLPFKKFFNKLHHRANRNTETKAKENISAHYDLSNDFFSLFLDEKMMYSSAIFRHQSDSLLCASQYKLDTICEKLELTASDHLLEIGTGWGGMAIHAAQKTGCRVTTTTISKQQFEYAQKAVKAAGLEQQITVLLEDYRSLSGTFDKLVSIEMIEAVGHEFYDVYFHQCNERLKPGGKMLLQSIIIPDERYEHSKNNVDFIQRYIFPGGCLPSDNIILQCLKENTQFTVSDVQDIGLDYAQTLHLWRSAFFENISQVKELGFDEPFIRMWDYYLCYCEGGFRERAIDTKQYVFLKDAV